MKMENSHDDNKISTFFCRIQDEIIIYTLPLQSWGGCSRRICLQVCTRAWPSLFSLLLELSLCRTQGSSSSQQGSLFLCISLYPFLWLSNIQIQLLDSFASLLDISYPSGKRSTTLSLPSSLSLQNHAKINSLEDRYSKTELTYIYNPSHEYKYKAYHWYLLLFPTDSKREYI